MTRHIFPLSPQPRKNQMSSGSTYYLLPTTVLLVNAWPILIAFSRRYIREEKLSLRLVLLSVHVCVCVCKSCTSRKRESPNLNCLLVSDWVKGTFLREVCAMIGPSPRFGTGDWLDYRKTFILHFRSVRQREGPNGISNGRNITLICVYAGVCA